MVRCLFEQQNQSKRVGCCGQSMATPNIRDPWSKIHVTLSTIKSEFKRTFSEDVKSRHSDLKKKPKLIPEKYKKPKPHPSSSRSGESNLLEIREVNYLAEKLRTIWAEKLRHSEAVSNNPNPSCCLLASCGRAGALHGQFGSFIWPLVLREIYGSCT